MWQGIVNNAAMALSHPGLTEVSQGLLPKSSGIAGYADGGQVLPDAQTPASPPDPRLGVIADAEDSLGDIEAGQPMGADHVKTLQRFHDMFGPTALQHLHANVKQGLSMRPRQGRLVIGAGSGKSDSIPARVDKVKEARLSSGEFIMPTDAVHGAGEGDPMLGAQRLQALSAHLTAMRPRVAMQKSGSARQPVNVEQVGYAKGGPVEVRDDPRMAWLRRARPDIAAMVDRGITPLDYAYGMAMRQAADQAGSDSYRPAVTRTQNSKDYGFAGLSDYPAVSGTGITTVPMGAQPGGFTPSVQSVFAENELNFTGPKTRRARPPRDTQDGGSGW